MAIEITGIDHVVLRVRDTDRACAFYIGVLGLTEERRLEEVGLIQLRAGTALIDLVPIASPLGKAGGAPPAPDGSGQNMAHLCLTTASRDAGTLLSHLARHGVSTSGVAVRYGADGFGPSVYVKDPDGNTIELKLSAKA
ncbi:MAG: VOC family protein [Alphaproteobacteria bacterium]